MPRGPRQVARGSILNITSRGNNKKIIFRKEKDYLYFKKLLLKYSLRYKIIIYHYCLMRNHLHLLVKVGNPSSIAKAMHGLQLSYFHFYRKRYGYVGRFWQGRFYSKVVEHDRYLLTAGLYIERNPVRAKLICKPEEYEWSSYKAYGYGERDVLVELDPYYYSLGKNNKERGSAYRQLMAEYMALENDPL